MGEDIKYTYVIRSEYSLGERTQVDLVNRQGQILREIGAYYLELERKFYRSYPKERVVIEQFLDGKVLITGPDYGTCIEKFNDFQKRFREVFDVQFVGPKLELVRGIQNVEKNVQFAVPEKILEIVDKETNGKYEMNETLYVFSEAGKAKGKEIGISLAKEKKMSSRLLLKITVSAPDRETVDRILNSLREAE